MTYIVVGIIPIGGIRDDYPLVQSRCHYNVADVYTVATVVQDYASNASVNRDVEYVFPLPPSAAVCAFKAVLDDKKVIKGVVKGKVEAKQEYDQAVAQGKTAGLLQQEHADVFRVSLGNIKPKQKISVHISFVSIVPHDGSAPQTLRITMPTAIAPRYGSTPTNIPWFGKNSQNRFDLTVAVQMSKPITSVSSPSHPIGLTLGCAEKELQGDFEPSKAFVYLGDTAFLDKDIVIVVSAQGLDTPRCTVERWLNSDGAEETTDAYALTLVPKFDLPALPRQEYVFLVDRSGSMGTGRMDSVKASLQIMLKSLPTRNTTFNIVSFGSSFTSLWPTSQAYSAESVAEASTHVDGFSSNYGGTELRSALEFAFKGRAAYGKEEADDKIPASVFILTDGEAWDLRGVLDTVTNNVEEAKKEDSLLRAFVLGVGNQVSTAMCEGIARAGKGTATFVAEGEKPDAKLMNLLKAARGAVIEELAVDWGTETNTKEVGEAEEDFEMVEEPKEKAAQIPPAPPPPISLFDDTASTSTSELGPQKAIVNLSPPPAIQQAPKSDQLPIPLYPGFRCSIFAIIRQPLNAGPHSPYVKITGKVLGREVAFQLPVTPISIASETTKDAVEGGRLLHTLAAKALIQQWEDLPSTPETKAQIERLGKRFTLASSMTSFLAIDEDTKSELHSSPAQQNVRNREENSDGGEGGGGLDQVRSLAAAAPSRFRLSTNSRKPDAFVAHASFRRGGGAGPPLVAAAPPPPPPQAAFYSALQMPGSGMNVYGGARSGGALIGGIAPQSIPSPSRQQRLQTQVADTAAEMRQNISAIVERGERLDSLQAKSASLSSSAASFRKKSAVPDYSESGPPRSGGMKGLKKVLSRSSPQSNAASGGMERKDDGFVGPITIESLARAQNFDGSFPSSVQFLESLKGGQAVPTQPTELANLGGDQNVKASIWATILTLACLQKSFSNDKDAWEMLAEKARDYIEGALGDLGVDAGSVPKMITDLTAAALASF